MTFNVAPIMPPLQQQLWDKTLNVPLAGGIVNFFEDSNRTIPKVVYELTGTGPGSYTYTSLGSTLTLSGIGTYIDENGGNIPIYLWPYLGTPNDAVPSQTAQNYYITVYSSNGIFQYDIPNWSGVSSNSQTNTNAFNTTENVISNGQFVEVNFPTTATSASPMVVSTTGTNTETEIAPDWSIVTNGNGTFSLWQVTVTDDTAAGNPAYALGINSTGYSQSLLLRQRLLTPRIFSGRYVSGTFIAETVGTQQTLSMNYTSSITGNIQQICTGLTFNSGFTLINRSTPVLIADPGSGTGYVDISIVIPAGVSVIISCVQLCGVLDSTETVAYIEETPEREVDHLFHYYKPGLDAKSVSSYLVGWDFPFNPAQFYGDNVTPKAVGANKSYYAWDQTILFQTVDSSLTVARTTEDNGISIHATLAGQFAIIQYLSGKQARDAFLSMFLEGTSVHIESDSNIATPMTLSLWWTANASLPDLNTNDSLVTGLNADGHPSVVAGWTEITRNPSYSNKFSTVGSGDIGIFGFPNFNDRAPYMSAGTFFAIVIGTSALAMNTVVEFNAISLVPGSIPTQPATKTPDEVLRECQFYYEKSYASNVTPGTNTIVGSVTAFQNSELFTAVNVSANFYQDVIPLKFKQVKRVANALIVIYSLAGNNTKITAFLNGFDSASASKSASSEIVLGTYWQATGQSDQSIYYLPITNQLGANLLTISTTLAASFLGTTAWVAFQYVIDARLGII